MFAESKAYDERLLILSPPTDNRLFFCNNDISEDKIPGQLNREVI